MIDTYLVLDADGIVVNAIVWDGVTDLGMPDYTFVLASDTPAWIGWKHNADGTWSKEN